MINVQKLPRGLQLYVVAVVIAATVLLWGLFTRIHWEEWPELLMFMVLITLASMFPVPNPRGGYVTSTPTLMYVLLSVHAPGAAFLVAGTAYAIGHSISRGWVPWRAIFNGAQMGFSVFLAALTFHLVGGSPRNPGVVSFLLPFAAASLVHQLSNNFFVSSFFSRLRSAPLLTTWLADVRDFLWSNLLSIPAAALLSVLYVSVHPATLFLYLASLPVQRWAIELYIQQKQIYDQAIDSLVVAIDANFPQGAGHSRRVANIAASTARRLKLSDLEVEAIELGGLLHDVGMIGLEDTAARPAGELNAASMEKLRRHVSIGAEVVREFPRQDISDLVLYHHENYDGSGYPRSLRGNEIPLGARIVAVAEAFDSMVSGGFPYEEKISPAHAIRTIREQAGSAFDPRVVDAFIAAMEALEPGPHASSTTTVQSHLPAG